MSKIDKQLISSPCLGRLVGKRCSLASLIHFCCYKDVEISLSWNAISIKSKQAYSHNRSHFAELIRMYRKNCKLTQINVCHLWFPKYFETIPVNHSRSIKPILSWPKVPSCALGAPDHGLHGQLPLPLVRQMFHVRTPHLKLREVAFHDDQCQQPCHGSNALPPLGFDHGKLNVNVCKNKTSTLPMLLVFNVYMMDGRYQCTILPLGL